MDLNNIALRNGIYLSKVKEAYRVAVEEASFIGVKSEKFIYETMEEILDVSEKTLSSRFIESGMTDFNKFLESLIDDKEMDKEIEEEIMSTDFSPSQKPEGPSGDKYNHRDATYDNGIDIDLSDEEKEEER